MKVANRIIDETVTVEQVMKEFEKELNKIRAIGFFWKLDYDSDNHELILVSDALGKNANEDLIERVWSAWTKVKKKLKFSRLQLATAGRRG